MTVAFPAPLAVRHAEGMQRLVPPEDTLARVMPHLAAVGITRVADITGLDRIGIPTFCAIRPQARMVQVTNGKGLSPIAARVSAIMEALEHAHAEDLPTDPRRASMADLAAEGTAFLPVQALPNYVPGLHLTDHLHLPWLEARRLEPVGSGSTVLVTNPRRRHVRRWRHNIARQGPPIQGVLRCRGAAGPWSRCPRPVEKNRSPDLAAPPPALSLASSLQPPERVGFQTPSLRQFLK